MASMVAAQQPVVLTSSWSAPEDRRHCSLPRSQLLQYGSTGSLSRLMRASEVMLKTEAYVIVGLHSKPWAMR